MIKKIPQELALDIASRSKCNVQMGAVLEDSHGIFSWGFNHMGFDGHGLCAEREAIRRANKNRLKGSTLYIAGRWRKSGNPVLSFPCPDCWKVIISSKIGKVVWLTKDNKWDSMEVV